jgi:hypothetical protein
MRPSSAQGEQEGWLSFGRPRRIQQGREQLRLYKSLAVSEQREAGDTSEIKSQC